MGFWNALSVLAPVAPALSDAQDIRAQRQKEAQELTQQAAAFPKEQALRDAQLTASKLAAQGEQQRLAKGNAPTQIPGTKDYYSTTEGSWMRPSLVNGEYKAVKIPGQAPADELKQATKGLKDAFDAMGIQVPPNVLADLGYRIYGGTGAYPTAGTGAVKPVTLKGPDGQPIGASFSGGRYYNSEGKEIENPVLWEKPTAVRPLSPATQFVNLYAKQILATQGKGPKLTPEEAATLTATSAEIPMAQIAGAKARAIENARYGITTMTDDSGQEVDQTRLNIANMINSGDNVAAGSQGRSTGLDKKNQMLAQSALTQIDSMERVLAVDPNLTGPGAGQLTKMQTWLGSNSEDSQQFLAAATFLAEHGVGVFGGRNIHSITDLQNLMGSLKTNPAALKAALEQARVTMLPWTTAGGRLPGPRAASGDNKAPDSTAPHHSLRTAMGLSFNKGKTAAQVKADLEAHHYVVDP